MWFCGVGTSVVIGCSSFLSHQHFPFLHKSDLWSDVKVDSSSMLKIQHVRMQCYPCCLSVSVSLMLLATSCFLDCLSCVFVPLYVPLSFEFASFSVKRRYVPW